MTPDAVRAAGARIAPFVRVTPLLSDPALDRLAGRRLLVKAECQQHTGSFKYRGATAALTALAPEVLARGVVAFSSGNHGQGVARAASERGVTAVVVMPADAPVVEVARTRAFGAEVVFYDRARPEDRAAIAARLAAERGLTLVPPFDHPEVIAGQASVGTEIAAQVAELGLDRAEVLVPCGGGGLAAGIALALSMDAPGFRVRTVEHTTHDDMARSLAAAQRRANPPGRVSLCDAILTPEPGQLTLPILARLAGPGLTVSDDEALAAIAAAHRHLGLVAEPGGAVALAAALSGRIAGGGPLVVVLSGGNVEDSLLARALAMGAPA